MGFLSMLWTIIVAFVFVAYLIVLFSVITDMFKDRALSGIAKILWTFAFIFIPFASMIIYFIFRGKGMTERREETLQKQEEYFRARYGTSPANEIAQAKKLLDDGIISPEEFTKIKNSAIK